MTGFGGLLPEHTLQGAREEAGRPAAVIRRVVGAWQGRAIGAESSGQMRNGQGVEQTGHTGGPAWSGEWEAQGVAPRG